ncbi:MAG: mechanosensitive ion channel family protein [Myxococcota bacterium]
MSGDARSVDGMNDERLAAMESITPLVEKLKAWADTAVAMLPNLAVAILVLVVFRIVASLVQRAAEAPLQRMTDNQQMHSLALRSLRLLVIVGGFLVALRVVRLDGVVTSALAGIGVVGLALGFAFQDIAANFVSGVILAVRSPFSVGDVVRIGDFYGTLRQVSLRSTLGETFEGQLVTIPNKDVLSSHIVNYHRSGYRRCDVEVGVAYGDDLERAEAVCLAAARDVTERDTERDPDVYFKGFGGSSIDLVVRLWISPTSHNILLTKHQAVKAIKARLDEAGLTIPFPIRTLDFGVVGGTPLEKALPSGAIRAPKANDNRGAADDRASEEGAAEQHAAE